MRVLGSSALIGLVLASGADAACRRPSNHSRDGWATSIVRRASVIMVAEVIEQENARLGAPAELRPVTIYKGARKTAYTMALPRSDGTLVTEAYSGFLGEVGERRLVILYKGAAGFQASVCDEALVADPAFKAALIRMAGR